MTDIMLSINNFEVDWQDPSLLAVVPTTTLLDDITNMVYASLLTDRVVDQAHQLAVGTDRKGCWQDSYVGEFGCLFWLALLGYVDDNSMLSSLEAYAQQALQWIYDDNWIQQPAQITADYISPTDIGIYVTVIAADGSPGTIYVQV
jgi:phage gp46-like protein